MRRRNLELTIRMLTKCGQSYENLSVRAMLFVAREHRCPIIRKAAVWMLARNLQPFGFLVGSDNRLPRYCFTLFCEIHYPWRCYIERKVFDLLGPVEGSEFFSHSGEVYVYKAYEDFLACMTATGRALNALEADTKSSFGD